MDESISTYLPNMLRADFFLIIKRVKESAISQTRRLTYYTKEWGGGVKAKCDITYTATATINTFTHNT